MSSKRVFDQMKQEVASELGIPLKEGYNGDITAKEAGKIGGAIVKKWSLTYEIN